MCTSNNGASASSLSSKARFYKKLRGFLMALAAIFAAAVLIDSDLFDIFRLVAAFAAISLGLHYVRLQGVPGTKGWLSDDWFDWIQARYPYQPHDTEGTKPKGSAAGEDYDPLWKDKDLV